MPNPSRDLWGVTPVFLTVVAAALTKNRMVTSLKGRLGDALLLPLILLVANICFEVFFGFPEVF